MRKENDSVRRGREAYNFVRQLNTRETMASVNLKWQNQQKKRTSMVRKIIIANIALAIIGLLYLAAVGININCVQADNSVPPAVQQEIADSDPDLYVTSVAIRNNHFDIHYDGSTCFQWYTATLPLTVQHPSLITYTTPVDDFDLVNIIACEA